MNEIGEKYLPVGTVVMLKGGSKRVMIAGFCVMSEDGGEKVYDYSGCLYPEGFISSTQTCLFDHEQIDKVYFKGFVDEEEVEFKKRLAELIKQINNSGINPLNTQQPSEDIATKQQLSKGESQTESDDDFLKNFPGPIDDVMKAMQEQKIKEVPGTEVSNPGFQALNSNTTSTQSLNNNSDLDEDVPTIEF